MMNHKCLKGQNKCLKGQNVPENVPIYSCLKAIFSCLKGLGLPTSYDSSSTSTYELAPGTWQVYTINSTVQHV